MAAAPPLILDVVEEHLEEASFLHEQWCRALASPHHTLAEVAEGPEERLRAHLAGLAIAAPERGEELLAPALGDPDPGKAFAAAAALASGGGVDLLREAAPSDPAPRAAAAHALALVLPAGAEQQLVPWLDGAGGPARALALEALALRGAVPPAALGRFLGSAEPRLQAAAVRAAAAAGDAYRGAVEAALRSPEIAVRDAALEGGLRMGLLVALQAARQAAEAGGPASAFPLELVAVAGEPGDVALFEAALRDPKRRRAALWAASVSGRPEAGDLCLPFLSDPALERLAFECLVTLGGPELAQLARAEPEPALADELEPPPEAEPLPWPEEELPLPDVEIVESVWRRVRTRLGAASCLAGKPREAEGLLGAFTEGVTRRRRPMGLELWLRSRGAYRVDTRAWAGDQLRTQQAALTAREGFGQPVARLLRP